MTNQKFLSEKDLDEIEKRLKSVFVTQEQFAVYRSDLMNKLDQILGEILKSRDEQTILAQESSDYENLIARVENTISP